MNKIKSLILTGCLALMATSASAIPFTVDVIVSGSALGGWSLLGPTPKAGGFGSAGTSTGGELAEGVYLASIVGTVLSGSASWAITVGGQTILSGYSQSYTTDPTQRCIPGTSICFEIPGITVPGPIGGAAAVNATAVPEPSTLALLGIGLLGLGFSTRRRALKS